MQNKGIKSVFKIGNSGVVFGTVPISDLYPGTGRYIVSIIANGFINHARLITVDNMVIEAHRDKYNNIIYREYEKSKKNAPPPWIS